MLSTPTGAENAALHVAEQETEMGLRAAPPEGVRTIRKFAVVVAMYAGRRSCDLPRTAAAAPDFGGTKLSLTAASLLTVGLVTTGDTDCADPPPQPAAEQAPIIAVTKRSGRNHAAIFCILWKHIGKCGAW